MGNRCIYLYLSYNSCSRLFIFFISANLCICNMQIQFCILSKSILMVIHGFSYETIKWIRSCSVLSILHYSYDCQATIKLNNVCLYIYFVRNNLFLSFVCFFSGGNIANNCFVDKLPSNRSFLFSVSQCQTDVVLIVSFPWLVLYTKRYIRVFH